MGIEQLTPHQRAEQALRAIDALSEGRVATDEQWAEVLKQPNVLPSLEIVAAAIEAAVQQERQLIYQVLNKEEAMYRNAAEEYEKAAMYEEQQEAIIKADCLVSIISSIALSVAIRSRSIPPVSADNKETNI